MGLLIRDRLMPVAPTPGRNRRQCAGVTVLCRYLPHHILVRPRLVPDVGGAEEGERGTVRLRMVSLFWSAGAEIDEARLVGMECESIPSKALAQYAKDPLGIEEVLERHYGVSRPGELHPQALAEPDVKVSLHTAPIVRPRPLSSPQCANSPGCRRAMRSSQCTARLQWRLRDLNFRSAHHAKRASMCRRVG